MSTSTSTTSTIEAYQNTREARERAIARIQQAMLPGADAIGRAHPTGKTYHTAERDLSGSAPFTGRTVLCWRSTVHNADMVERGSPPNRRTSTQVIVHDGITPEQLTELARIAVILTAEVTRAADSDARAACSALDVETRAYASILPFLRGDAVRIIGEHERAGERGRIREVLGDGAFVCGLGDDIDGPAAATYIPLVNLQRE